MVRSVDYTQTAVAADIAPIVTSDVADNVPQGTFGVYVTSAGDITMVTTLGNTRTFPVLANTYHFISFTRVLATGTTAAGLYALVM